MFFFLNRAGQVYIACPWHGNRSSHPKVMLPEVKLPETGVMLPEIHCHVARNPESYRPKYDLSLIHI